MPYATEQALIHHRGQDALDTLTQRDGAMPADVLAQALEHASSEIDAYLSLRYSLPLSTPTPALLRALCVDICVYHLATNTLLSEDISTRYTRATELLSAIAAGQANLGALAPTP